MKFKPGDRVIVVMSSCLSDVRGNGENAVSRTITINGITVYEDDSLEPNTMVIKGENETVTVRLGEMPLLDRDYRKKQRPEMPAPDHVIVPRSELVKLEEARKLLYKILEAQCEDLAFVIALSKVTDPMWHLANRNWPEAKG